MILDARAPEKPAGILIDTGTNRRIPYARTVDFDNNTYEALATAPNGIDYLCDERMQLVILKGKAVGQLKLVPLDHAEQLGVKKEPEKVSSPIQPLSADIKLQGLESYKEVYFKVWNGIRGESNRCVASRFDEYLKKSDFLDTFCVRRRSVPVR